jgi:hypothetical protein
MPSRRPATSPIFGLNHLVAAAVFGVAVVMLAVSPFRTARVEDIPLRTDSPH